MEAGCDGGEQRAYGSERLEALWAFSLKSYGDRGPFDTYVATSADIPRTLPSRQSTSRPRLFYGSGCCGVDSLERIGNLGRLPVVMWCGVRVRPAEETALGKPRSGKFLAR